MDSQQKIQISTQPEKQQQHGVKDVPQSRHQIQEKRVASQSVQIAQSPDEPSQAVILATIPYTVYQPERTSQPISHQKEPSVNVVSILLQQQTNQSREQLQTANVVSTAQQHSHQARWHQTAKTVTARLQGGIGVDRGPRGAALGVRLRLAVEGQVIVTAKREGEGL